MYENIFKYPGNKSKFLTTINSALRRSSCKTYVEPFFGGGTIFFNLSGKFDTKIINDIDPVILKIVHALLNSTYDEVLEFERFIVSKFGNVSKQKDSYYAFREYVNTLQESKEKQLGLFKLSRACINSMIRFGPNGFNQGFGNRGGDLMISKKSFDLLKYAMQNTSVFTIDYQKLQKYDSINTVWILDPPYNDAPYTYNSGFVFDRFKDFVRSLIGNIIYFDTRNDFGETYFESSIKLRDMTTIAPRAAGSKTKKEEMMYFNF